MFNKILRGSLSTLCVLVFLAAPLVAAEGPVTRVEPGFYAVDDLDEPLLLEFTDDFTFQLFGGSEHLYRFGSATVDGTIQLACGNTSDELMILEEAKETSRLKIVDVNADFLPGSPDLIGKEAGRLMPPEKKNVPGTYVLAGSLMRQLELKDDGTYTLVLPWDEGPEMSGHYMVKGLEVVIYDELMWPLMSLVVTDEYLMVPAISEYAGRLLGLRTADYFERLIHVPDVIGIYESGVVRLVIDSEEVVPDSTYALYVDDELLPYRGGYFAYNNYLYLTETYADDEPLEKPRVLLVFRIDGNRLNMVRSADGQVADSWPDLYQVGD